MYGLYIKQGPKSTYSAIAQRKTQARTGSSPTLDPIDVLTYGQPLTGRRAVIFFSTPASARVLRRPLLSGFGKNFRLVRCAQAPILGFASPTRHQRRR